jgi:hypothetical protein
MLGWAQIQPSPVSPPECPLRSPTSSPLPSRHAPRPPHTDTWLTPRPPQANAPFRVGDRLQLALAGTADCSAASLVANTAVRATTRLWRCLALTGCGFLGPQVVMSSTAGGQKWVQDSLPSGASAALASGGFFQAPSAGARAYAVCQSFGGDALKPSSLLVDIAGQTPRRERYRGCGCSPARVAADNFVFAGTFQSALDATAANDDPSHPSALGTRCALAGERRIFQKQLRLPIGLYTFSVVANGALTARAPACVCH